MFIIVVEEKVYFKNVFFIIIIRRRKGNVHCGGWMKSLFEKIIFSKGIFPLYEVIIWGNNIWKDIFHIKKKGIIYEN